MQEYRSGHNEAVLKTVGLTARGFESLFLRHKRKNTTQLVFFLLYGLVREDSHPPLYCVAMQMGCASRAKVIGELAHQGLAQTHFACKMYPSISYFHICCKTFFGDLKILQGTNKKYALIVLQNPRGEIPLPAPMQWVSLFLTFTKITT